MNSIGIGNLDSVGIFIKLRKEGMQLDVEELGKGFAADEAIKIVEKAGYKERWWILGGWISPFRRMPRQ